jgi:glutamate-1-semialdehyde 2,1-aminomutase
LKQPITAGDRIRAMATRSFIEERYRHETPSSAALMLKAADVMPGGNTRTTSYYPPYPVVIERGDGPW